jgi:2-polyprenyl-3-methyl-5-hydroxy-6-metoxy-1,4-benzoquinol methylase
MELIRNKFGYLELQPKPKYEELAKYYSDKYFNSDTKENSYSAKYSDEEILHKKIDAAECGFYTQPHHRTLLDIGCGEGFFLNEFHQRGFEVKGLDFTPDGINRFFPELLPALTTGDLYNLIEHEIKRGRQYDVITCNNVLEHVIDPEMLCSSLRKLLAPRGIARLQVPNDDSFMNKDIVERKLAPTEFFKIAPDHLNYFSFNTFKSLVERSGWTINAKLGSFPIGFFLYNSDSNYRLNRLKGKNCHHARIAIDCMLYRESLETLIAFRRGCGTACIGNDVTLYCTLAQQNFD